MPAKRLQLTLPTLEDASPRPCVPNAVVEVVLDPEEDRVRVRPLEREGWVKFPKRLREPGVFYKVELLKPLRGGAWTATGKIRRLPRRKK